MNELEGAGIEILLFAVRCLVPIALTFTIARLMNRMVDKWEREAAEQKNAQSPEPFLPVAKEKRPSIALPCWVTKGCDPARRADCPANQQRGKPCWVARLSAEGVLPADCPDCPVYRQAHA
ncbi:MAG: hypothetical protein KBE23_10210 [Chloroflexi bacterium]|nr:hypothetical protein [Chloroflexota bacterium]MBP7043106.1 hypothetical protein [Chloroflexota bacterium]